MPLLISQPKSATWSVWRGGRCRRLRPCNIHMPDKLSTILYYSNTLKMPSIFRKDTVNAWCTPALNRNKLRSNIKYDLTLATCTVVTVLQGETLRISVWQERGYIFPAVGRSRISVARHTLPDREQTLQTLTNRCYFHFFKKVDRGDRGHIFPTPLFSHLLLVS